MILFVGGPPKGREILAKRMGENGFGSNPVGADKVGLGSLISGWTEFAVMEGIRVTTTQLFTRAGTESEREVLVRWTTAGGGSHDPACGRAAPPS